MTNKHMPPAVGEFAVGERDQLLGTIAKQAREIERLRLNIAEYNEHERCYQSELAALKAQPSAVDERAAFEAHMRVGGYSNPDKHPDGSYVSSAMELWWQGWKARAALSAPSHGEQVREGFDAEPFIATIHMIREAYAEALALAYAPGSEAFRDAKEKAQKLEQNLAKLIRIAAAPSAGSQGGDACSSRRDPLA